MGFEPTTLRDLVGCSNHLSYWRLYGEQGPICGTRLEPHHAATQFHCIKILGQSLNIFFRVAWSARLLFFHLISFCTNIVLRLGSHKFSNGPFLNESIYFCIRKLSVFKLSCPSMKRY